MAFPAADFRLIYAAMRFFAIRLDFDAALKSRAQRTRDPRGQSHVGAGIRVQNTRHGTGLT